jgi:site-specific recombinase XerD
MTEELTDYLAELRAEGHAEVTLRNYRSQLEGFAKLLRSRRLRRWRELKPADIDAYIKSLGRHAPKTRESYLITSRAFVRWLYERGKVLTDPTRHVVIDSPEDDDVQRADGRDQQPSKNHVRISGTLGLA